jgi:pilus assembly protein Flp/PilA
MKANLLHILRRLHNDESGQDLTEYALIAALIALAAISTMNGLSVAINSVLADVSGNL